MTSFFFDQSSTFRVGKGTGIGSTGSGIRPVLIFLQAETQAGLCPVDTSVAPVRSIRVASLPSPASAFRGTLRTPAVPIIAAAVADFRNRRRFRFSFVSISSSPFFRSGHVDIPGKGLLKFVFFPLPIRLLFCGGLRQALLERNADDFRTGFFDGRGYRGYLCQDIEAWRSVLHQSFQAADLPFNTLQAG